MARPSPRPGWGKGLGALIGQMELWSAFLIGLVGSLHCAGMCGPLALAVPVVGRSPGALVASRAIYNLGRITTYGCLGVFFGLVGHSLALAGLQRWASLGAGLTLLVGLGLSMRYAPGQLIGRATAWLKSSLGFLLRHRTMPGLFCLGFLNGLLPCGLVYVAGASAVAAGGFLAAVGCMLAFGLGTVPMMFGIGLVGNNVQSALRLRFQRFIPACVLLLAALLIVRGLALGIPFLSPNLGNAGHFHH